MGTAGQAGFGVVSFFSGIGGLDLGFERAGFRTWMASELHQSFREGYLYSRLCMMSPMPQRGILDGGFEMFLDTGWRRRALVAAMGEAREEHGLVGFIGGPPCPDFSIAGLKAGEDGINGRLTQLYVDLVCALQPDFFVMENVAGLWMAGHIEFYLRLRRQLADAGFHLDDRRLNTLDYHVAQDRPRVIAVGFRERSFPPRAAMAMAAGFPWQVRAGSLDIRTMAWPRTSPFGEDGELPVPPGIPEEMTVEGWFRRNHVCTHDNARNFFRPRQAMERFASIAEGDTRNRSFKRLHRWRYSPTAAYGNNEVHLHPYKPRRLSVAEAMAIQSFPFAFALPHNMSLSDMFKAVGNAVPVLFAEKIAATLRDVLAMGLDGRATESPMRNYAAGGYAPWEAA